MIYLIAVPAACLILSTVFAAIWATVFARMDDERIARRVEMREALKLR